ncbi:MAG TPA: hypothetical protein VKN99_26770 [Polyangia bacterium]|nr:hypothetical protein [Polyangia bacterium]
MRTPLLLDGTRCEICGLCDPTLLAVYWLGRGRDRSCTILCQSHAAPVEAGVLGRTGTPHRPCKGELFEFWEQRRPGIVWMSLERRILRDRRDRQRAPIPDRRRILR